MCLHAPFGPAEFGPGEQVQAQRDGGGIQRQKFVLEAELGLAGAHALLFAEAVQRAVEQVFEERRRAVFIGIRQGGFVGCVGDAEMHQFAFAASQAVADLA